MSAGIAPLLSLLLLLLFCLAAPLVLAQDDAGGVPIPTVEVVVDDPLTSSLLPDPTTTIASVVEVEDIACSQQSVDDCIKSIPRCVVCAVDSDNRVCMTKAECLEARKIEAGASGEETEYVDACGVLMGDNSTCVGCDGVPNSGMFVDPCGVCGGDGKSCFHLSSVEYIGIILAISGNALVSISLSCQKHAHNINEALGKDRVPYVQLRLWWVGQILMVLGECGNFLAYAYAPATLVAPLGSVTVISNALIAYKILHEPLFARNIVGCLFAVLGSILVVLYAPSNDRQLTMDLLIGYISEPIFVGFLIFVVCFTAVLLFCVSETTKKRHVTIYVLICSLTGCITVMCTKGLSTAIILSISGSNQFKTALPWILLVMVVITVAIQIRNLNLAMISFGASEVVPVYYVLFTFCSVLAGIILFHEWHESSGWFTLLFLVGCSLTFVGVYLITSIRKEDIEQRRAALFERAGLLEDPDELWNEADDLDIWDSDDESVGDLEGAPMRILSPKK